MTDITVYRSDREAAAALILAHGAGAGQRHPFMVDFATNLSRLGLDVITFDFPYITAGRRLPDRGPALHSHYRAVIDETIAQVRSAGRCLVVGGKSMGGRIATEIAAADPALPVRGFVLLGYPLHPPGRPDQRRDRHLPSLGRPALFVQGSRDTFGTPPELAPVFATMSPAPTLHVVEGGDHSFKLPRRDPAGQATVYADIQRKVADWIRDLSANPESQTPSSPR